MGEIIDLEGHRRRRDAGRSFRLWEQRVGYMPHPDECLADLPDSVLARLAELDQEATLALYDLVLGVKGLGPGERFDELTGQDKVAALDAFLCVADQVRFELMHRLGWVESTPAGRWPMLELATDFQRLMGPNEPAVPPLAPAYPRFAKVQERLAFEPHTVVRQAIPEALKAFRQQLNRNT